MKLSIPYIPSRGFECGQTCAAMMIKYYYPRFKPDFEEFNKIIHHKPGKYTFPHQNAIILNHYGVKAKCFSSDDLYDTEDDFKKGYGKDWYSQKKFIDLDTVHRNNLDIKKFNLFEKTVTPLRQIVEMAQNGILICLVVDWNTLIGRGGEYQGHFLLISGLESNSLLFHDPDDKPFVSYPIQIVEKAYSHPVITHDLFAAYGKK